MTDLSPLFTWRSAIVESGLPACARHVALTLSLHMNERGASCFPTFDVLQAEVGVGRSSIVNSLRHLEDGGWLQVDRPKKKGPGKKNHYSATFPEGFTTGPFLEKRVQGMADKGSPQVLEDVKRTFNEKGAYICEHDGLGFKSQLGLDRHVRNVHEGVAA